jgi:HK97 family phage prohead protease
MEMTPNTKNKLKNEMQIRSLQLFTPAPDGKRIESDHYVEGYAARYEPYVLYELDDGPIYERFERGCFDNCDMSDIIFQLNHQGTVMARQSNGSLIVEADASGLFTAADLGRTEAARNLYEEISTGMITKMSWGFILGECYYDAGTRTIVHKSVKKIFDVSAVSIPANQNTEINARSWADGVIGLAARSEAELDERRRRLRLKIKLQEESCHEN